MFKIKKRCSSLAHLPRPKFNYLIHLPETRCSMIARDDHQSYSHTVPSTPKDRSGVVLRSNMRPSPRRAAPESQRSREQLILLFICRRRSGFSPHCSTIPVPLCYCAYCMTERYPKDHLRPLLLVVDPIGGPPARYPRVELMGRLAAARAARADSSQTTTNASAG